MRADDVWRGYDLVLEAGVELHVPRLVDLLGREERRFLLTAEGSHEAGELRCDPLLCDHQRGEDVEDQIAIIAGHLRPLAGITGQIDPERRPLRVLPTPI